MSVLLMGQAWQADTGGAARKLVLIKLADNADDNGICWPSYGYIAAQCEMSKRTAMRYIDDLVLTGFIDKKHRKGGPHFNKSNQFRLTISEGDISNLKALKEAKKADEIIDKKGSDRDIPSDKMALGNECHSCHPTSVTHDTTLVSCGAIPSVTGVTQNHHRTTIEPSLEPSCLKRIKKPSFIHEIFNQYPAHRRGGTDAQLWKVWKQEKLTENDAIEICNWLTQAAQSDPQWGTSANGQFVQGLTKFIRERVWLTPIPIAQANNRPRGNDPDFHSGSTEWANDLGL